MKVLKNKRIPYIPPISQPIDDLSDLAYIPPKPLPAKSSAMYIVGAVGAGKTSFWNSAFISHPTKAKPNTPRMYYRFFDKVFLISPSMKTLNLKKLKLNDDRMFLKYSDELMEDIVETEQAGENLNNAVILDDCIRDLTKSKSLSKIILNRRHCCQNDEEPNQNGLTIFITSQKYNALSLLFRTNMSHFVLFATRNRKELDAIKDELMTDLTPSQQDEVLKLAWTPKYGFLFIDSTKPTNERYYQNFNRIVIESDSESDEETDDEF